MSLFKDLQTPEGLTNSHEIFRQLEAEREVARKAYEADVLAHPENYIKSEAELIDLLKGGMPLTTDEVEALLKAVDF